MDQQLVHSFAEAHTRAVIDGDIERGARDLLKECIPQALEVMRSMPPNVVRADIEEVVQEGQGWRVQILYHGDGGATARVESLWVNHKDRPMVRAARIIP